MAETLGSLCDKLTIVKLKQWHSNEPDRLASLAKQENQLQEEIDEYISNAISGAIPSDRLVFASNKVYKKEGNQINEVMGSIGEVFSQLALVNCQLWHEQEKVYEFEKIPINGKDQVVKQLALLNLQRNRCIDRIDQDFSELIRPFIS